MSRIAEASGLPPPASLTLRAVSATLRGKTVVDGVSLRVAAGERWAIVGPNGAGKSTLLRLMYGRLLPACGEVWLDERPLAAWGPAAIARRVAVVTQTQLADVRLSVQDYVALGRIPHRQTSTALRDRAQVASALAHCGLQTLAGRAMGAVSGGEQQRAALARALAQEPALLLLDEPTNHLDLCARAELLDFVRGLGITVVAVLHDLSWVSRFADRVAILQAGALLACGSPSEVLDAERVRRVFDLEMFELELPGRATSVRVFEPLKRSVAGIGHRVREVMA